MACEARDPGQRGAGLRLGAPLDQLLQVDYSGGEQSLNLDTGSAAELSPLETMLGLKVGHDALAHNPAPLELPIYSSCSALCFQRTLRARVLSLWPIDRLAEREMLGGANQLRAGGANVEVAVDEVGEIVDAEAPGVVALSLLVQGRHDASGFAFPQPSLGAVAAVADQFARCSAQVDLVLVHHLADRAGV